MSRTICHRPHDITQWVEKLLINLNFRHFRDQIPLSGYNLQAMQAIYLYNKQTNSNVQFGSNEFKHCCNSIALKMVSCNITLKAVWYDLSDIYI